MHRPTDLLNLPPLTLPLILPPTHFTDPPLQGMSGSAMKPDLQKWLGQRIAILKQLAAKDEL